MTLTFVSNYINHHQIPVSNELYKALGDDYRFIQVMPMEKERQDMGWGVNPEDIPYLLCYYHTPEACRDLIVQSDIVVFGGVEDESYIKPRLELGKITIRYSERLYREGQWKAISPRGLIKKYKDHYIYRNKNVYLLCAGAYTASDFSIIRSYPGKMFKWGYFTEFKDQNLEQLLNVGGQTPIEGAKTPGGQTPREEAKNQGGQNNLGGQTPHEAAKNQGGQNNLGGQTPHEGAKSLGGQTPWWGQTPHEPVPEILFAGRFLPLKHPEYGLKLARHLKENNLPFHMTFVGDGDLRSSLEKESQALGLSAMVSFEGYKSPGEVRSYMEHADIFLMTSNHLEGWGAVINEAMNSGCAVIACDLIGAVPFLIQHNRNGLVYKEGDVKEFLSLGEMLVREPKRRKTLAQNAYYTIRDLWNPSFAAKSLLEFSGGLLEDKLIINQEGPLSPAPVLFPSKGYEYVRK